MRKIDKEIVWQEEDIREVLVELDKITGLHGAELPILFGKGKKTVACFCNADGGYFRFSKVYFHDVTWPIEEAIDTIRHEYAHYMDYTLYGHMGHGASWKQCCHEIGALALRFVCRDRVEYFKRRHSAVKELQAKMDTFEDGEKIRHPKYGVGRILVIYGPEHDPVADVYFKFVGTKQLSLSWIAKYCKKDPVKDEVG